MIRDRPGFDRPASVALQTIRKDSIKVQHAHEAAGRHAPSDRPQLAGSVEKIADGSIESRLVSAVRVYFPINRHHQGSMMACWGQYRQAAGWHFLQAKKKTGITRLFFANRLRDQLLAPLPKVSVVFPSPSP